ncbi:MAG: FKBP-type peptidyl-prolyl cis-trans isomerase [Bacteroidota bacterium]
MKKEVLIVIVAIIAIIAGYALGSFFPVKSYTPADIETEVDTFAYGSGLDLGMGLTDYINQFGLEDDFPVSTFISGVKDGFDANEEVFTRTEAQMAIQQFVMQQSQKMEEQSQSDARKNLEEGEKFLAENKEREEVKVTDSGLQYEVLEEGSGPSPAETDTVVVHYHGTLIDGTVFDSSVERGEPATFAVDQVIEGWTEALQMMQVGGKWKLYIPSDLAYGPTQRNELIQGNTTLIFEVELLEIK